MDYFDIIADNAKKYAHLKPCDLYKLIYQGEFGCSHFCESPDSVLPYIKNEIEKSEKEDIPVFEEISENFVRVNLNSEGIADYDESSIAKAFISSSREKSGSRSEFMKKIKSIADNFAVFGFSFSKDEFLRFCENADIEPVHHSAEYKKYHHPHYRVVNKDKIKLYIKEKNNERM